jgi:hypothetical protein
MTEDNRKPAKPKRTMQDIKMRSATDEDYAKRSGWTVSFGMQGSGKQTPLQKTADSKPKDQAVTPQDEINQGTIGRRPVTVGRSSMTPLPDDHPIYGKGWLISAHNSKPPAPKHPTNPPAAGVTPGNQTPQQQKVTQTTYTIGNKMLTGVKSYKGSAKRDDPIYTAGFVIGSQWPPSPQQSTPGREQRPQEQVAHTTPDGGISK